MSAAGDDGDGRERRRLSGLQPEALGAFIDAVYAIAVTILALEIPGEIDASFDSASFGTLVLDYCIAFAVLFTFWVQHRRINAQVDELTRGLLWLNAAVMLLVCLVPRATTLVFAYGGDVTLVDIGAGLLQGSERSLAAVVDGLYVAIVFLADALLLLLTVLVIPRGADAPGHRVRRTKIVASALLSTCLVLSLALPFPNRYFVLLLPLALFFEDEVTAWLESRRGRSVTSATG